MEDGSTEGLEDMTPAKLLSRMRTDDDVRYATKDPSRSKYDLNELLVHKLLKQGTEEEKLQFLLSEALDEDRKGQRDDDVGDDNGIKLFARQKKQSRRMKWFVLAALTWIYAIQLVALYNLGRFARIVYDDSLVYWIDKGHIDNYKVPHPRTNVTGIPNIVRETLGKSSTPYESLYDLGYCLTPTGEFEFAFNVGSGLFMIYLLIFQDIFNVIFDMPVTRNFPWERPDGVMMLLGEMWLVALNAAVLCWLGVVAGQYIISNAGSFPDVLNQVLNVFIVVAIDEQVLPLIRAWSEEANHLDMWGNLNSEQLDLLTHGSQYYKPGYGHNWMAKFRSKDLIFKVLPLSLLLIGMTIVIAPAVAISLQTSIALRACP